VPTPLETTWNEHETFRDAVRIALGWDPNNVARLTITSVQDFPDVAPELNELGPQPEQVLAVVNYLSGILYAYPSVDVLLADLRDLVVAEQDGDTADVEALTTAIRHLLPASPDVARQLIRQAWEHSANPYLSGVQGVVDFRAIKEAHTGDIKFVPVGHLRLVLDEPAHSHPDVIVFQVAPSELEVLAAEIDRMMILMREAEEAIGESIF
jgi:hypothetical protein